MKISELLPILESTLILEGDLEVVAYDGEMDTHYGVDSPAVESVSDWGRLPENKFVMQ